MSLSLHVQKVHSSAAHFDVLVVEAGPYGLLAAAHLQGHGLKVAIFGKPLKLWREHMPKGMLLRSYWWATNLSDPEKKYGLENTLRQRASMKAILSRSKLLSTMGYDYLDWRDPMPAYSATSGFVRTLVRRLLRPLREVSGRVRFKGVQLLNRQSNKRRI